MGNSLKGFLGHEVLDCTDVKVFTAWWTVERRRDQLHRQIFDGVRSPLLYILPHI